MNLPTPPGVGKCRHLKLKRDFAGEEKPLNKIACSAGGNGSFAGRGAILHCRGHDVRLWEGRERRGGVAAHREAGFAQSSSRGHQRAAMTCRCDGSRRLSPRLSREQTDSCPSPGLSRRKISRLSTRGHIIGDGTGGIPAGPGGDNSRFSYLFLRKPRNGRPANSAPPSRRENLWTNCHLVLGGDDAQARARSKGCHFFTIPAPKLLPFFFFFP